MLMYCCFHRSFFISTSWICLAFRHAPHPSPVMVSVCDYTHAAAHVCQPCLYNPARTLLLPPPVSTQTHRTALFKKSWLLQALVKNFLYYFSAWYFPFSYLPYATFLCASRTSFKHHVFLNHAIDCRSMSSLPSFQKSLDSRQQTFICTLFDWHPDKNQWSFVNGSLLVWEDNCPHLSVKRTNIKTFTLLQTQSNAKCQVNCV